MTINELEQAIRNLIATQPAVMTGSSGEVVNGVLSIIDAFRNLSFRVQTYPVQDVMKFNMNSEMQKFENNFSTMVCQMLQERGINLMLYVPRMQPMGMQNQYGMSGMGIDANMVMGQMMYGPAQNTMMQPQMQRVQVAPQQMYAPMGQPMMQMMGTPQMTQQQRPMHKAPAFPGFDTQPARPIPPTGDRISKPKAPPQSKIKQIPKVDPAREEIKKTAPPPPPQKNDEKTAGPSPAEMLMGGFDSDVASGGGKAAGRDYLMELLKK